MGNKVTFDYSKAANVIREEEVSAMEKMVEAAKETLVSKNGLGNDFLGWIDLPVDYDVGLSGIAQSRPIWRASVSLRRPLPIDRS